MAEKHFYILTDTHYVSKRNYTPGSKSFSGREKGDQIALRATPEILRSFFDVILADDETDALLITGDLVNSGDMNSHEDFRNELKTLTDAGKRVFVTTATHDYCGMSEDENFFTACRYTEDGAEPIGHMRKSELLPFYYDFGPAQSDSVHEASGSYSLRLFEGVRLIAINDNGNGRSHCGLFEDGFRWLEAEIDKAAAANEKVLLAVHHPVISPWDVYAQAVEFEMFGGYRQLTKLMCEKGVRVIFTGHTHIQNIRKYTDDEGRYFYDVSTTAMSAAAGCMRKVTVDPEAGICKVETVRIPEIKNFDTGGKSFRDYIYHLNFVGKIADALPLANRDWAAFLREAAGVLPTDKLAAHKTLAKFGIKKAENLKLKTLAKFGRNYGGPTKEERISLGDRKALPALFEIVARVQAGNGPFPPETTEYKVFRGTVRRVDKICGALKIRALEKIVPQGQTLWDVAEPFVYNNRTGDDDTAIIQL